MLFPESSEYWIFVQISSQSLLETFSPENTIFDGLQKGTMAPFWDPMVCSLPRVLKYCDNNTKVVLMH